MNIIYMVLIVLAVILFAIGFIIGIISKRKKNIRWDDFTKVINIHELTKEYRNDVTTEMEKIEEEKNNADDYSVPVILHSTLLEESLELYDDELL